MEFNKLIPELAVSEFEKSLDFYTKILGFKIEYSRNAPTKFAFLSLEGSQIMINELALSDWTTAMPHYPFGRGINFQIEVKCIDPILESLRKNNYSIMIEPEENWYEKNGEMLGNREFLVKDPDGYLLRFSQDIGTKKKLTDF